MNNNHSAGAASTTLILQVVFLILKLCNVIDWSWWCVLIPLWVDLGMLVLYLAVFIPMYIRRQKKIEEQMRNNWYWRRHL